jgi:hypothetical protein
MPWFGTLFLEPSKVTRASSALLSLPPPHILDFERDEHPFANARAISV